MSRKAVLASCFIIIAAFLSSQERAPVTAAQQSRAAEAEERVRIAIASPEYPVTPGDSYQLAYRPAGGETVTRSLVVNGDYSIDLGIFGKIDATNLTFADLKAKTEALVLDSYTRSIPSLTLASTGAFRVGIRGEVERAEYPIAWGLTRLSEVVSAVRGQNASNRIVEVVSKNNVTKRYDLVRGPAPGGRGSGPVPEAGGHDHAQARDANRANRGRGLASWQLRTLDGGGPARARRALRRRADVERPISGGFEWTMRRRAG